jgi:hypothetical protein
MKYLITIITLFLFLNAHGQSKYRRPSSDGPKTGPVVLVAGIVISAVAVVVPDGIEWTYMNNGPSTCVKVYTPMYRQPARMGMLGVGVCFSVGGLIYTLNHR